jgi:2-polyprenyl-3-methyl-5-hydroxy-6-metoxy-1,4-benzoquinol methylase
MMEDARHCAACEASAPDLAGERTRVRSNVRAFSSELFEIWRCTRCQSLHASEEVDLAHYYAKYPFFALPEDARLRILYDNQLRRLRRAGLRREHRILDYGAGGGGFVRHLSARGFERVAGYDRYSPAFNDPASLDGRYDCVITQDVLEHVPSPPAMLDELGRLVEPGGLIAIGTPNADAIDLRHVERYVHALHLPYHRHIFSKQALLTAGTRRGWRFARYYRTQYANTAVPFLNSRFYLYYMRLCDDSLDCLMEPPRPLPLLARLPLTLFWGLFGGLFAPQTDVMAIFRR